MLLRFLVLPSMSNDKYIWTFTVLSFNILHLISTPYNRSLTCAWFYLRYKIRKVYKLSAVLFPVVLKVANFLLPYLCSVFPCCVENLLPRFSTNYARSFCSHLGGVCCCFLFLLQLCQRSLFLWLCINVLRLWGML